MTTDQQWAALRAQVQAEMEVSVRQKLAAAILVGPHDDRGVAEPGKEHGDGFAIFIGEWRLGWWATRAEACEEARKLDDAIVGHKVR